MVQQLQIIWNYSVIHKLHVLIFIAYSCKLVDECYFAMSITAVFCYYPLCPLCDDEWRWIV